MRVTTLGLLRAAYVLVAGLVGVTLLPRLGLPTAWAPDLVLLAVVATAVLRGPTHGALVGLASGWVVELIPPVGRPIGLTALTYLLAGLAAGGFRRTSARSLARPFVALAVAAVIVFLGRTAATIVADGGLELRDGGFTVMATMVAGLFVLPAFLALDRALVRRRLG